MSVTYVHDMGCGMCMGMCECEFENRSSWVHLGDTRAPGPKRGSRNQRLRRGLGETDPEKVEISKVTVVMGVDLKTQLV